MVDSFPESAGAVLGLGARTGSQVTTPPRSNDHSRRFYPELQALRGYAAAMVVLVHCVSCWAPMMARNPLARFVSELLFIPVSGMAPVILFFVLSGFVLTSALRVSCRQPRWLSAFYIRRLLRIVPSAYAGLVLTILAVGFAKFWLRPNSELVLPDWINNYLSSSRLVNLPSSLLFRDNLINPVYWTLHVELVGSLILPCLFWFTLALPEKSRIPGTVCMVVLMLLLPAAPWRFAPISHMSNLFLFCFPLGMLVSLITDETGPRRAAFAPALGLFALLALLFTHAVIGPRNVLGSVMGTADILIPTMGTGENIAAYLQQLIEAVAAALVVGSIVLQRQAWAHLTKRTAIWLGEISFSLYVVHFPILMIFIAGTAARWQGPWAGFVSAAPVVTFGFVFPVSIIAAHAMYRCVERPAIRFGKSWLVKTSDRP
jgi:peptidoglycan/LPS O-acetylase OafA/YrhL